MKKVLQIGLGTFAVVALAMVSACPTLAQEEAAAAAPAAVQEAAPQEAATPVADPVQEPVAEAEVELQPPFNCPDALLWYVGDVYVYSIGTCEPLADGYVTKRKEGAPQIVSFAKEIEIGATKGDDGKYACTCTEPTLNQAVVSGADATVGYIQGRTDFRSNVFLVGEKHYRAIYFTAMGTNENGDSVTYEYRIAIEMEGAVGDGTQVGSNECVVEGGNLVVKAVSEDGNDDVYAMFNGTFTGVPETIVEVVQPEATPAPTPDAAVPAPAGDAAVPAAPADGAPQPDSAGGN